MCKRSGRQGNEMERTVKKREKNESLTRLTSGILLNDGCRVAIDSDLVVLVTRLLVHALPSDRESCERLHGVTRRIEEG